MSGPSIQVPELCHRGTSESKVKEGLGNSSLECRTPKTACPLGDAALRQIAGAPSFSGPALCRPAFAPAYFPAIDRNTTQVVFISCSARYTSSDSKPIASSYHNRIVLDRLAVLS